MRLLSRESAMRYSALRVISFLVAVWMCCTVSKTFAGTDFDDITITPELDPSGNSFHGYAEYRIAVSNRSPDKAHQVTLILPKMDFIPSGNRIREMTRTVIVGPSATVHVSLLQPPVPMNGNALGVVIDGKVQKEEVPLPIGRHGRDVFTSYVSTGGSRRAHVSSSSLSLRILISRNVDVTDLHYHAGRLLKPLLSGSRFSPSGGGFARSSRGGPTIAGPYQVIDLGIPVSAWSRSWLGFSRYDGVIVTGDDIRQMPPDVQSALWRYVECGGALFVLGGRELPENWRLKESLKPEFSTGSVGIAVYEVGFGQCIVSLETDTKSLDQKQWKQVVESWLRTAAPWQWEGSVEEANRMFPVVSGLGIPVRGLFLLMLLFGVAIGPVNLIVLSRKKRRIWMLWTTPVISAITCLAVFAYATFAEGWNRQARTEGLTILDERARRATTIGWTGFYSALTPGDGLHFGYETELTPRIHSMATNRARTVDWTHDQHLATGWVTARVPAHFMVRKSETRRERVTVRKDTNIGLRVVNGLGATISQFWLADKDGTIYSAADISAGEEANLAPLKETGLPESGEMFLFELWAPLVNQELDKRSISSILRDEMVNHGLLLSDDVTVFVSQPGKEWLLTDSLWGHTYNIKTHKTDGPLKIHGERLTNLRAIFASDNWIENIERLKITPEKYLRPGCYIASLNTSPFIEEGLQNVREKQYSSVVYGILDEE